ncbi:MAG: hypothetical protein L3K00_08400 [Thermoplasmata archaeon]|nr:hypothetical protein [Thermoplasmata archaeon]
MDGVGSEKVSESRGPARPRRGIALLRLGLGAVWAANAVYILDPANQFFSSFSGVAASFGSSTIGGPGLAQFVAQQPFVFSAVITAITLGLAVSFLSDVGVRVACLVGAAFNVALLVTQWGQIATIPGGTDIGPQPLYLLGYAVVWVGYQAGDLSLTATFRTWVARRRSEPVGPARAPRSA